MSNDARTRKEEIARKLLALISDSSVTDGEREAAEARLEEILEKYDLNLEDLAPENLDELVFKSYKYRNAWELKLIIQLNAKLSDRKYDLYYDYTEQYKRSRCMIRLEAPLVYHVEFEAAYEIYKDLYYRELKLFETAFLHKHNLFPQTPREDTKDADSEFSAEDLKQISMMTRAMKDQDIHKLLTSGIPQLDKSFI